MISAIVLAAGAGTRFGETKQLVEVRGKPMVQHAVDAATAGGADEIVVVLGHDADRVRSVLRLPSAGRWVVNHAYLSGMASSLSTGLAHADPGSEGAAVLLADQPGITAQHVRSLLDAFHGRRAPIVRLAFRSGPGPALIARELWREVQLLEGDVGARDVIARHPGLVENVDVGGDAPVDVDVPDDLDRA
ncbi:MAG TPA: nucleotidyltransferase family protein [Actinomycetota bacterium]|nr:nucleotidyltransferase family protein [Actinomycetota bacterium]